MSSRAVTFSMMQVPAEFLRVRFHRIKDGAPVYAIARRYPCIGTGQWNWRSTCGDRSAEVGRDEKIGWMEPSETQRALAAAMSTTSALGLTADDAIVLHDSNRLAVRLLPCDVLARVAPSAHQVAQFEVDLAQRLAETESPVGALEPRVEPRVYERDGFVVTLWTYYKPVTPPEVSLADYANALERLHAGMRKLEECQDAALHGSSGRGSAACGEQQPHSGACRRGSGAAPLARYGAADKRSATAALPSSYCTASRTQAMCSVRRRGCCSSTSRHVAVGPSSSTSPMSPKMSASAMRTLMKNCSASAAPLFLPWSPRGAGIRVTNSRTGNEQVVSCSGLYARVHRGRRSTP